MKIPAWEEKSYASRNEYISYVLFLEYFFDISSGLQLAMLWWLSAAGMIVFCFNILMSDVLEL